MIVAVDGASGGVAEVTRLSGVRVLKTGGSAGILCSGVLGRHNEEGPEAVRSGGARTRGAGG